MRKREMERQIERLTHTVASLDTTTDVLWDAVRKQDKDTYQEMQNKLDLVYTAFYKATGRCLQCSNTGHTYGMGKYGYGGSISCDICSAEETVEHKMEKYFEQRGWDC